MNRRGFLGSILALGAAPAIVRADSLMRIIPREATVEIGRLAPFEFFESDLRGSSPLAGLARVALAADIRTDSLLVRLDTSNGIAQHCITVVVPERDNLNWREHVREAEAIMRGAIIREHGSLAGFSAPPPIEGLHCEVL